GASAYSNSVSVQIEGDYQTVWNGQVGVIEEQGILTRISASGAGDAGAISENLLEANSDGVITIIPNSQTQGSYVVGFSQPSVSYSLSEIAFGISLSTESGQRILAY